ncbi:hypothetical protein [Pacificibacter sp. AS14]|uniref:hypothetical protein n=1 Tax=Pacificibacter sp. AS14 TaxID=3135785 RepID=UPI00317C35F0
MSISVWLIRLTLLPDHADTKGLSLVEAALSHGPAEPYAIQVAISALHAQATSFEDTDCGLYTA